MKVPTKALTRRAVVAATALAACAGLAAGAYAISVYENDFGSKAEYEQIARSGGGKDCNRRYRDKSNAMRVVIAKGPATCAYRTPVVGDSELPNHALGVDTKILKETSNSVRGGAFIEATLRAGGGGVGYTLRVFPAKRTYELVRNPGGGADFPTEGESRAIKGVNKRNKVSLVANGARLTATVNGEELASVRDRNPGQVTGRKVRFAIGNTKSKAKETSAVVKSVSVGVPSR